MPKKILHIIDSLAKGGAEMLLIGVVNSLPNYQHLIVTFEPENQFADEIPPSVKLICLHANSPIQKLRSVPRLRRLIKEHEIDIVHSHLYWPTIVSRLSIPRSKQLISSYHNVLYGKHGSSYSSVLKILDRITYRSSFMTLSVSGEVKKDLEQNVGITKNSEVLYNYIEDVFYEKPKTEFAPEASLKIVSVGNLKPQKNYLSMVEAFARQVPTGISWDIYGEGPERDQITRVIEENSLHQVQLKG
ncbi:MAG: glycosyltransferase, partial [Bacteroidota bacterium]